MSRHPAVEFLISLVERMVMFKNHPRGLMFLFFTEMWERFGFYIMMAIFVLYMDEKLGWDDARKGNYYGGFPGIIYFIPILGGWLGDRVLGHRNTIKVGATLMVFGYTALTFSSRTQLSLFYAGLVLIAVGTGESSRPIFPSWWAPSMPKGVR
jgi:POT family proton-dependent oligopeptide transporter